MKKMTFKTEFVTGSNLNSEEKKEFSKLKEKLFGSNSFVIVEPTKDWKRYDELMLKRLNGGSK